MKYLILVTLVLVGCGKAESHDNSEFSVYIESFRNDALAQGVSVELDKNLKFQYSKDLPDKTLATCSKAPVAPENHLRTVTVNLNRWVTMSETARKLTIYHELGHCVLYRGHNDNKNSNGWPVSIMNPQLLSTSMYIGNETTYIRELFLGF